MDVGQADYWSDDEVAEVKLEQVTRCVYNWCGKGAVTGNLNAL